jgi:hypothetical protein
MIRSARLSRLAWGATVALAAGAAGAATAPLDPPRQYLVRGTGSATVGGSHCCGDTRFTGRFEAAYEIASTGAAQLTALRIALDDVDVVVSDGFLGLFTTRAAVRCAAAANVLPAAGGVSDPTHLKFPPGTVKLFGQSSQTRFTDGSCDDPGIDFNSANDVEVQVLHDPAANAFALDGTFHTVAEGETYSLTLHLAGGFTNRAPQAALAMRPIDEPYPQGGCPAYQRWNGQQWEWVAEANRPSGLKADLRSFSYDPDGGSWSQGDVFAERWFDTRNGGTRSFLGQGRQLDALTFEWGPQHRVELLAIDHVGASSAASCTFRVIDTRPPVVTPPAPIVLGCSTAGGATPGTSAPLQSFLNAATATDLADPAPARLTPTLGGSAITSTTLFPADGAARTVTFPFRDFSGNVGQAGSTVTVRDTVAPTATASASPATLAASYKWWWITTTLSGSDNCGGTVTFRLVSIASNAPGYDAGDVLNASYGTDDRGFYLFTRPAAPGVPRVWTIKYEAKDARGNSAIVSARVTVG